VQSNRYSFLVLLLMTTYWHVPTHAAPPSSEETVDKEITVIGLIDKHEFSAKMLRSIQAAYAKNRHLAPQAPLRFRVEGASKADVALRFWLSTGDDIVNLPISADGTINLSNIVVTKETKLYSNRANGVLNLRPEIFSPNTTNQARRLGDLRLECRITWAMAEAEIPLPIKVPFAWVGNPCASKKIGIYLKGPFPLSRATVEYEDKTKSLPVDKRDSYRPPIYDKKVPNEAVVRLYP
jgi:hypothetical protein